ncbi:MAG: hypothetical protein KDD60_13195, partial [Bdellovibrionales bacterium]|nr:hypothetical protein [Bdellovibrionales bacterium]
LALNGCDIKDDRLLLTYFAPRNVSGVLFAKTIQEDSNVKVHIQVERGTELAGRITPQSKFAALEIYNKTPQ